jgi:hypothetical protein
MVSHVTLCTILPSCRRAMVVDADLTLKLIFICKDIANSRHDPDPGIKKVITPTFVPLRPKR